MKKLSSLLAATVLVAAIGMCMRLQIILVLILEPCVIMVVNSLMLFVILFNGKQPDLWVLTSEPFSFGKETWQTVYTANMPGIDDPQKAVEKGQNDYNYSILMTKPEFSTSGTLISCRYSPEGNYLVYADNQVLAGFKKFM